MAKLSLSQMLLELHEGKGGDEWLTCGPHLSLRWRAMSYVTVNADMAWLTHSTLDKTTFACARVLKVHGFDSWALFSSQKFVQFFRFSVTSNLAAHA